MRGEPRAPSRVRVRLADKRRLALTWQHVPVAGELDLVDALASALEDQHRAWEFIRRFVAAWHKPLVAMDGWSRSELRAAARDLSARFPTVPGLPAALAEMYALLGRRADLTSNQDRLLDPTELCLDTTGEVLVVRRENQGCAQWGIRVDDLRHDERSRRRGERRGLVTGAPGTQP